MCGDCFVCIYLVCQCDGLELGRRNRRITVRGVAVRINSLRMVVFLSQLNDLEIWGADVGNAYLEAYTDETLCIIAGPEFKELQGHLFIMIKALYGTCSGGSR